MAVAVRLTDYARVQIVAGVRVQDGQQRLEQRDFDLLSKSAGMTGVQSQQDGLAGEQPGREVGDSDACLEWVAARFAIDAHETAEGLHGAVVASHLGIGSRAS